MWQNPNFTEPKNTNKQRKCSSQYEAISYFTYAGCRGHLKSVIIWSYGGF